MPNTYAFTKNLGEALCVELMEKLPIIVTRPSVGKDVNCNFIFQTLMTAFNLQ